MEEEIFNYEIRVGNNRYILGKRLGFGAFGEIYWGTTMTGEHIAVKMVVIYYLHNSKQNIGASHCQASTAQI